MSRGVGGDASSHESIGGFLVVASTVNRGVFFCLDVHEGFRLMEARIALLNMQMTSTWTVRTGSGYLNHSWISRFRRN